MKITNRELLLRGILKENIDSLNKAIASEERIIELGVQMDMRHGEFFDLDKYSKLLRIVKELRERKIPYSRKLTEIDNKIEKELLGEINGNNKD